MLLVCCLGAREGSLSPAGKHRLSCYAAWRISRRGTPISTEVLLGAGYLESTGKQALEKLPSEAYGP